MKRLLLAVPLALILMGCDEPIDIRRSPLPGDPAGFDSEWSTAPEALPAGQVFEMSIVKLDRGFDTSTWEPCSGGEVVSSDETILAVERMTVPDRWLVIGVRPGRAMLLVECRDTDARYAIEVTDSRRR